MFDDEIWTPVKNFPGYMISTFGRVQSFKQLNPHINKPRVGHSGYPQINLSFKNKKSTFFIHRLVLEHFGSEPPEGYECAHLDGNRLNNHISNLQWKTSKENHLDKIKHGTLVHGQKHPCSKLKLSEVEFIRRTYRYRNNISALMKMFKVSRSTIWKIVHNVSWKSYAETS